ncbi:MAG: putative A/G-specific adenine glycosylase YfhQ [Chlamydiota bacterium]|jgi:A/G-specific adenine glycosylase
MLQQTRASVVVPYFLRWMEQFPTMEALASASEEQVIKAWEGLGYYSRVRGALKAARDIVDRFGGTLPQTKEQLRSLPGFGPYTVGACLSFAYQQNAPAIDGNVTRVVTRLALIETCTSLAKTKRAIEEAVRHHLDADSQPWVVMEALIELGATICQTKPQCGLCPIADGCKAKSAGKVSNVPWKAERPEVTVLHRHVAIIEEQGKVWVRKGDSGRIMAGLYEFPYVESPFEHQSHKEIARALHLGPVTLIRRLASQVHHFTRYKAFLYPVWLKANASLAGYEQVPIEALRALPFSSGHRRVMEAVVCAFCT